MIEITRYLNGYLNLIASKVKSYKKAKKSCTLFRPGAAYSFLYDEHELINREIEKHYTYPHFILAVQ